MPEQSHRSKQGANFAGPTWYWGYVSGCFGIVKNEMETSISYWGICGVILGLYWDNGTRNGNWFFPKIGGTPI